MLIDEINSVLYLKKLKHNFLVAIIIEIFNDCCCFKSSMFFTHTRFFNLSICILREDCKTRTAFHSLRKFVKIKNFQYIFFIILINLIKKLFF